MRQQDIQEGTINVMKKTRPIVSSSLSTKFTEELDESLQCMRSHRIPKAILHYQPHGKRSLGRTKKHWKENASFINL